MTDPAPEVAPPAPRRTLGQKLFFLGACVVPFVAAAYVVTAAIVQYRDAHLRTTCKNHLKQLGLALHSYHDKHDCFPPAYTLGPDGQRWHSWRVLVLPFLGEEALYTEYHFDEPWNGPHNAKLASRMPEAFGCPAGDRPEQGLTNYLAIVGRRSAWPEHLSLSIRDFQDGTSNTLLLVESADSDIAWLEPRDLTIKQTLKWHRAASGPRCCSRHGGSTSNAGATMLLADGAVRFVSSSIHAEVLGGLITPAYGGTRVGASLPADAGDSPPEAVFPAQRDATSFPGTDVLPYPSMPFVVGKNYLYCSTFRMAWDTLRFPPDNRVHAEPLPVMAAELNRLPFPKQNLDPASYLVQVERLKDIGKINDEMARRFPGASGPRTPASPTPGWLIFAYLRKSLPFAAEFASLDEPLLFPDGNGPTRVASFGQKGDVFAGAPEHLKQVRIHDYLSDDDFILELISESKADQMIFAKIPRKATLQETIDATMQRIRRPNPEHINFTLEPIEDLIVPKLSFNVLREYPELENIALPDINSGEEISKLKEASQGIAFVLDERGAELESFAEIQIIGEDGGGMPTNRRYERKFVFNRPFLLMLRERQASEPYLALWVENTELMMPFAK